MANGPMALDAKDDEGGDPSSGWTSVDVGMTWLVVGVAPLLVMRALLTLGGGSVLAKGGGAAPPPPPPKPWGPGLADTAAMGLLSPLDVNAGGRLSGDGAKAGTKMCKQWVRDYD